MATASRVRIVHGHGMGVLKRMVADMLGKHPTYRASIRRRSRKAAPAPPSSSCASSYPSSYRSISAAYNLFQPCTTAGASVLESTCSYATIFISVCAIGLGAYIAGAQQISRKEPARYDGLERASRGQLRPPGMRLGLRKPREFALAPLSETELSQLGEPGTRLKTGIRRALSPDALASGTWETTNRAPASGAWRSLPRFPRHARRVRRLLRGRGNVWVHDGASIVGPYTGRGLFDDGHFWSAAVFSGSITVEYEPAPGTPMNFSHRSPSGAISHQARTALDATAGKKDPADFCELDANCYPDWHGSLSSVEQISFMDNGDEILCSGSLLSTRDNSFKPYFLTAGHCINNEAAARTVEAYWTYQTPACGGVPPATRTTSVKSTRGRAPDLGRRLTDGDFSLILLQDAPAGATFAGWDIADPPYASRAHRNTPSVRIVEAHFLRSACGATPPTRWRVFRRREISSSGDVEQRPRRTWLLRLAVVFRAGRGRRLPQLRRSVERQDGVYDQPQRIRLLALLQYLRARQGLSGEFARRSW